MSGTMRGTPSRGSNRPANQFPPASSPANSNIPRPVLDTHGHSHQPTPSDAASGISASRQKQSKRDEAIRRKMESDLSKKKHLPAGRARHSRKAPPGTVLALKPSPALQIKPNTTVSEAAQLMAAKREDCVLVTNDEDRIAGIFTAKDLAFRVVGTGQKAANVTIAEIMTKNPLCARTDTSATEALDLMVRKGFRHLPVMDENQDISGILDITKCFYDAMEKLERAYATSTKLYAALEGVQSELGTSQPQQIIQYVEALRTKMSGPTLESVLDGRPPTTVSVRTTVKEAAMMMKENHTTAVLVQDQGQITGIFTSKDVVLRVIAPGLEPATCSVVRVMTPHPDFAPMDMSIQAALRKMHDGHYLNLPVMNDQGEIVGMVDVLKLTYATLEQINTMGTTGGGANGGPAWDKFWLSVDNETESMVSGDGSHHHGTTATRSLMSPDYHRDRINDSVAPGDSASHVGMESPVHSTIAHQHPQDIPFAFKFKAPSGRVHRLQVVASEGIDHFVANVAAKLGGEVEAIGGVPVVEDGQLSSGGFALSYLDDEGDTVSITTDQDLLEAILLARHNHREKVDLFVHDPEKPPVTVAAPQPDVPAATPVASSAPSEVRRRRHAADDDDEDDESEEEDYSSARRRKRSSTYAEPDQVIAGVPNELLLPGAIVTLAVVIVGVFAIARATSRAIIVIAMIIRDFGVRQGELIMILALAAPLRQACLRTLSTTPTPTPTGVPDLTEPTLQSPNAQPQPPSIFTTNARASVRRKKPVTPDTTVEDYNLARQLKSKIGRIGSKVKRTYRPSDVFLHPPGPKDVTLELLMASQAHMGHHASLWNPANARYIYGIRQGIHIISLEETAAHLRRAARVVEEVAYRGGLILFVGTRPGQAQIVTQAAALARACHLFTKWTPGSITNSEVILAGMPIQMLDEHDEPVQGYDRHLMERRPLIPDLVVCLNPMENYVLLHECSLVNVPTIGVIDTNAEPTWVTYGIPANDDSLRCLAVIGSVLGRAGEAGHKRRIEDAKKGIVAWQTPLEVANFLAVERENAERKAAQRFDESQARAADLDTGFQNSHMDGVRSNLDLD
ncbi:hypothetical protein F5Y13DRAFT_182142 [Hypoxylon sp. FL1857]|nr:hypothetical protein F5Y13DRAFT_182142 [Hypoxylon sp. FL1857]